MGVILESDLSIDESIGYSLVLTWAFVSKLGMVQRKQQGKVLLLGRLLQARKLSSLSLSLSLSLSFSLVLSPFSRSVSMPHYLV